MGCVWPCTENWGRGVLRTIQEELLELVLLNILFLFFNVFITDFQHFSASVCILKNWQYLRFCKLNHFAYPGRNSKRGKKLPLDGAVGKRGRRLGRGKAGKSWRELLFSYLPPANPSFSFSGELCEPVQPLAMARSLAISRDKEKTWDRKYYFGVGALSVSFLVKISLLIMFMSTESDLKADALEKSSCACFGGMLMSKGGWFLFSFPQWCQRVGEAGIRLVERGC